MSSKITELQEPQRGWRYHSGQAIYVERFRDGRLIAAQLQATGIPYHARHEDADELAFNLQVDGESLHFGWDLAESRVDVDAASGCPETVISLKHTWKPLRLDLRTMAAGDGFFRRRMTLTNVSADRTLALTSVTPFAGTVFAMIDSVDIGRVSLAESGGTAYRVGWMRDNEWGQEGNFQWQDVPVRAELAFGSLRGRSGHTTPFAVAHNNVFGGYFVASLAWSANWRMSFTCDQPTNWGNSKLRYALMPVSPAPMRLLAPGETLALPDVHFGLNHESFDQTIQAWHAYQRRHVLPRVGDGRQPFIYNHWGFTEHELSEASLRREIEIASEIGAELFMVDAGWYADANTTWQDTSGDWQVGNRLPNGLEPVFKLARSKGLLCGLWVEIESAGKLSKLAATRPDWFIKRYGKTIERVLDLAKPEVRQYVEDNIMRLIERYQLDMFRLDYNMDAWEGGFNECDGRQENTLWRHVEAMYAIFDKVRARYPKLQLENCSSGGGRTDLGLNSRFTTAWISDWLKMPRTLRILNGMSMAMPPEYIDRMFGVVMEGSYKGNAETQLQVIMLAHPAVSGLTPSLLEGNPDLLALAKKYVTLYKDFIRPWHRDARLYHHTPVIPGNEASGWCALENVAADRTRAMAGIFRLVQAREDTFLFRFRGLDPARRYRVTTQPGGLVCEVAGLDLQERGLCIRLDTPLTSRLLLCEAV